MTAQHVRATQRQRRKFTDQLDYEILLVLATDTGRNNEPATTSYRGIAERAGCHYNTVNGHINNLVKGGWIEVVKAGKYHHYRLLYDCGMPDSADYDNQPEIVTTDYDNPQTLSQRLSQVEQRLSQLDEKLSQVLSQIGGLIVTNGLTGNMTKESEVREESEGSEACEARAREGDPTDAEFMDRAVALVGQWQGVIGHYGRLLPDNPQHRADYFAPALRLIVEFGGDLDAAWVAIEAEYGRMVQDGFTNVRKLAPVVSGVLGQLHRDKLPARASPNGTGNNLTRAEAAALEYAAMKEQFFRSDT